jgi:hypothetical protein
MGPEWNHAVMAVFLNVVFALGATVILLGLGVAVVRRLRDHRTSEERRADEHGDLEPGTFKITPGMGQNTSGPGSSTL